MPAAPETPYLPAMDPGKRRTARAVVLYGGSVKPDNIDALLGARGVDGVLVGGASLEPASFARICLGGTGDGRFDPQLL